MRKKITVQRHRSPHGTTTAYTTVEKRLLTRLLQRQVGESGELCFVFLDIIHHPAWFVNTFFVFFLDFFVCFFKKALDRKKFRKKTQNILAIYR